MNRKDLSLRAENIYALSLSGITDPDSQLLFLSDIPPDSGTPGAGTFPSNKFALVDHNNLEERYSMSSTVVTAIIDHHADEKQHLTANPRVVMPAGSCASLVTHVLLSPTLEEGSGFEIPSDLATLLLCAIFIDTNGLKPKKKALPVDYSAAFRLLPCSSLAPSVKGFLPPSIDETSPSIQSEKQLHDIPALQELTTTLDLKKSDLSQLSTYDVLRRDFKEYTIEIPISTSQSNGGAKIKAGLCTVPLPLKGDWAADGKLLESSIDWMTTRNLSILGILTAFHKIKSKKGGKGKHMREMAWFVRVPPSDSGVDLDTLSGKLFSGLKTSEDLALKKHKKFVIDIGDRQDLKVKVYKQGNADVTRKGIAPLLQSILETA
ncbi:hypothetical protein AX15_000938 [Amanita polypyramis BW_CC]|nr:hypothetical protein AX15_000938 [Amanita polypyramis BW_CC]